MTQQVKVREGSVVWTGQLLWRESSVLGDWAVIRPDDYGTHVRRGSGSREYSENLIRVPTFLNSVLAI